MYIVKITNGRVELYNDRGCYQRAIVSSNAVFADIDMTQTKIVVTLTSGKVELYNEMGCYQRTIFNGNAIQARWVGNDIAVTVNGHVEIYDDMGCYLRRF